MNNLLDRKLQWSMGHQDQNSSPNHHNNIFVYGSLQGTKVHRQIKMHVPCSQYRNYVCSCSEQISFSTKFHIVFTIYMPRNHNAINTSAVTWLNYLTTSF